MLILLLWEIENYDFGIVSFSIMTIPNIIKISPKVLELNHVEKMGVQTWPALYTVMSFMQRIYNKLIIVTLNSQ
jgi:hypothetical protein